MKLKLLGPVMGLCLGLGIAIGCGGSSTSDAANAAADSGPDGASNRPDSSTPDASSPADAGQDAGDPDAFVPGTEVPINYGGCAAFTPCGGDPKGTWTYAAGGCIDAVDLSGVCPAATITNTDVKVKGTVTFSGSTTGTVTRVAQVSMVATLGVPQSCVNSIPIALLRNCPGVQLALLAPPPNGAGFDTATCADKAGAGSGCDCDVAKKQVDNSADTFTVAGNVITTSGAKPRTYDFCVNPASTFKYQETTSGAPKATFVMSK